MSGFDLPWSTALAQAVAEASAFAASVPMPGTGTTFRLIRGGLALVLVPALMSEPHSSTGAIDGALRGATIGLALGLAATIAFSAARAAGTMAGNALQWSPLPGRDDTASPMGSLFELGFATVLFASGGFESLVLAVAQANDAFAGGFFTLGAIARLITVATHDCLLLAAPALFAQALAALVAGVASRAAPQVGGLLMASPLVSAAVGLTIIAAGSSLFERFAWIVRDSSGWLVFH